MNPIIFAFVDFNYKNYFNLIGLDTLLNKIDCVLY